MASGVGCQPIIGGQIPHPTPPAPRSSEHTAASSPSQDLICHSVYYDSYMQSFFEELAKFMSASRNLMREAKMVVKIAYMKRARGDDDGIRTPPTQSTP